MRVLEVLTEQVPAEDIAKISDQAIRQEQEMILQDHKSACYSLVVGCLGDAASEWTRPLGQAGQEKRDGPALLKAVMDAYKTKSIQVGLAAQRQLYNLDLDLTNPPQEGTNKFEGLLKIMEENGVPLPPPGQLAIIYCFALNKAIGQLIHEIDCQMLWRITNDWEADPEFGAHAVVVHPERGLTSLAKLRTGIQGAWYCTVRGRVLAHVTAGQDLVVLKSHNFEIVEEDVATPARWRLGPAPGIQPVSYAAGGEDRACFCWRGSAIAPLRSSTLVLGPATWGAGYLRGIALGGKAIYIQKRQGNSLPNNTWDCDPHT
jgi:hypothetical protein